MTRLLLLILVGLGCFSRAPAVDHVTLLRDGRQIQVDGRLLVTAEDGGLLLLAADGVLWAVPPEEQVEHTTDAVPFKPLSPEEMSRKLLAELPQGFGVHETAHYLIFHDTSRAYAQWCGSLFERLHRAFTKYWTRQGLRLSQPEFPLVAVVFADRATYAKVARPELGDAAESIIGYFSLRTNRMMMWDLTELEKLGGNRNGRGLSAQINRILARPDAQRTVATIVHEATHQIAYSCGLHTRYSDCPLWLSEGIAIYFETPDLRSPRGWRSFGTLNRPRLMQFLQYCDSRPADSLQTLVGNDGRFRDPEQNLNAYAEAWALTYYLIREHREQYLAYLRAMSEKKPLVYDGREGRLKQFRQAFGDLELLDRQFLRYVSRLR